MSKSKVRCEHGVLWSMECLACGPPPHFVDAVEFEIPGQPATTAPTEATEQTWCDHCSADLNGVRHILCERCYREYAAPPALAAAQPKDVPTAAKCAHGVLWDMECLSCGPSDFIAATQPSHNIESYCQNAMCEHPSSAHYELKWRACDGCCCQEFVAAAQPATTTEANDE